MQEEELLVSDQPCRENLNFYTARIPVILNTVRT